MNLRDLKYLVALAQHRHFGKAAEACFVSQPALSMQIKKLEDHFGVKLLERNNKSILFTEIGTTISQRAQIILDQVKEINEIAKAAQDPECGELKVGIFPTLAPYLLPHIALTLSTSFPKLTLYWIEQQTDPLLDQLKQGKIDAAILALPITEETLMSTPLFEEEFFLAVPHAHPLTKTKSMQQNELENKILLLLTEGHCLRDQALALCHKVKAQETENFQATSLETLRHMVAVGLGMTLMPKLACKPQDTVAYVPFDPPVPYRRIGILWRTSTVKQQLLEKIATRIQEIMMSAIDPIMPHPNHGPL